MAGIDDYLKAAQLGKIIGTPFAQGWEQAQQRQQGLEDEQRRLRQKYLMEIAAGQAPASLMGTLEPGAQPDLASAEAWRKQKLADAMAMSQARYSGAGQGFEYRQDAEGNWVALPKKATYGQDIQAQSVLAPQGLQPLQGKVAPPPKANTKIDIINGKQVLLDMNTGSVIKELGDVSQGTWVKTTDEQGNQYLYNNKTRETKPLTVDDVPKAAADRTFLLPGETPKPPEPLEGPRQLKGVVKTADKSIESEKLAKAVQSNKPIQEYRIINQNLLDIETSFKNLTDPKVADKSGAKSALVDNFQRIINPRSVVRVSAFAQTTQGQSLMNRMEQAWDTYTKSSGIAPSAAKNMVDLAREFEKQSKKMADAELSPIRERAKKYGIEEKEIIPDWSGGVSTPSGAGGTEITLPSGKKVRMIQ